MIPWQKLELLEECLNQLDYDDPRGWDLVLPRLKGRRKKVIEALVLPEQPTIKEMCEIFNSSTSNMKQIEFRAIRALSNVLKKRGLTFNDFVEAV